MRIGAAATLVVAAAAAAILLNLALLGYAQPRNDPVGKLSPRAVLAGGPTQPTHTVTVQPPPTVITVRDHHENDD